MVRTQQHAHYTPLIGKQVKHCVIRMMRNKACELQPFHNVKCDTYSVKLAYISSIGLHGARVSTYFSVCSVWLLFSASPSAPMCVIWVLSSLRTANTDGQDANARKPDVHRPANITDETSLDSQGSTKEYKLQIISNIQCVTGIHL